MKPDSGFEISEEIKKNLLKRRLENQKRGYYG